MLLKDSRSHRLAHSNNHIDTRQRVESTDKVGEDFVV